MATTAAGAATSTSVLSALVVLSVCFLSGTNAFVIHFVFEEPTITCWTCPHKADNEECNNWAPDFPCLTNMTVCKTIHRIEMSTGRTLSVHKQCARSDECTAQTVGCHDAESADVQECVSCCTESYCNEAVPTDQMSALRLSSVSRSAKMAPVSHWSVLLATIALVHCFTTTSHRHIVPAS